MLTINVTIREEIKGNTSNPTKIPHFTVTLNADGAKIIEIPNPTSVIMYIIDIM
jgi:hypothetical protein